VPLRVVRGGERDAFTPEVEESTVTLKDVAGMEAVKRRLELAFLAPMRNPEMRRMYGKQLRGGLLLYGPPGCGKTFIAKAVAGELGAKFIAIGLPDVLNLWLGESERNVHEIFENARAYAPCVLFFDELDALGRKRSLMRNSSERNVVNQLLAELDSVGSSNEGVFVLAATNHPWDVDSALRRPGRLDRTLLVLPPDLEARAAILTSSLEKRPVEEINVKSIAALTEYFSGADLVHLCEAATELAMEDSLRTGTPRPIRMEDFRRALRDVKASTRGWFSTARNYAEFANEGGMFDDLVEYLRKNKIR
jgi:SpoVK/Ycf46/Vps4 family AAA+-type ATPase